MNNLVNSLVIAVINPDYYGRKVFATFLVQEQIGDTLKVLPLWCEDYPEFERGFLDGANNSVREIKTDDIWVFPTTLSKAKEDKFRQLNLDYRFYKDEKALERLASKLDMDKMHVGYDGEPEDGTWFNCCRTETAVYGILPDGFHVYSLRASDEDDSQPASIERQVAVNHFGDILTDRELPVPVYLEVEHVQYDEEGNIVG